MKTFEKCPVCGQEIRLLDSTETGKFWKCGTCNRFFADENGKPQAPEVCPACGENTYTRFEVQKAPSNFFWGCSSCKHDSLSFQ